METLLALLALLALCVFFTSLRGVNSGAAPLLSVSAVMVYFSLAGMLGVLRVAGVVFYLGAAGLCAWALICRGGAKLLRRLASPGVVLFVGMAVILLVWLAIRRPVFSEWDEFSFWGSAAKRMSMTDRMYVGTEVGGVAPWPSTERPGLVALSYFAQFFGRFAPYKTFWAYDLLLLACGSAMVSAFEVRRWRAYVPLWICGLLLPFCFEVFYDTVYLVKVWMSAYADVPSGMLFGGVLAVYWGARKTGGRSGMAALPLGALALCKENLIPIALLAAGVMAVDGLLFGGGWQQRVRPTVKGRLLAERPRLKGAVLAAGRFAGWFMVPLAGWWLWQRYAAWATRNFIATNVEVTVSVGQAMREVVGLAPRSPAFYSILQKMADQFLGRVPVETGYQYGVVKMSMLGSGLATMLVIVAVFVLAAVLADGKRARRRIGCAGALLFGGFWAYQFGLFVVYAYFSKPPIGSLPQVFDYGRYLGSYFAGWLMTGLVLLGFAACSSAARARVGRTAVLAFACLLAVRSGTMVRPGYSVLDYPDSFFSSQRAVQQEAERLQAYLQEGQRLFFVCQGGDASEWYQYSYHLMPVVVDQSLVGGRSLTPQEIPLEQMAGYLEDRGCDGILVVELDEIFTESYGTLFADGLTGWPGKPTLYMLDETGLYRQVS